MRAGCPWNGQCPREIWTHFQDVSDQAVPSGVVGHVLGKVGLQGNAARYIQPWQVMESGPKLEELSNKLRASLAQVHEDMGKQ